MKGQRLTDHEWRKAAVLALEAERMKVRHLEAVIAWMRAELLSGVVEGGPDWTQRQCERIAAGRPTEGAS